MFAVLDDICFQMHGQSEGADVKLLEVSARSSLSLSTLPFDFCIPVHVYIYETCTDKLM